MGDALVGCSGWNYAHWRERVYPRGLPARLWLEHYARLFRTVEVNATFYRLPTRKAVQGWADGSPPGFVFAVKASRYLTHIKRLRDLAPGVALLRERIEPLETSGKLGPILWQLPESFHRDDERLAAALEVLGPGRHAFEFRHPSWFHPDVDAMLRAHDVALVVGDHPQRGFQTFEPTASWSFVRFHYGSRGRRGNYSDRELETWAQRIERWRELGDVYAYFNNDWEGFAVRNGLWLQRRLGDAPVTAEPARA